MKREDWKMRKIEIELNRWGDLKGQYSGSIEFENGENCSFTFALRPEMTAPYLHLIANEVAASANQLAEKIAASFQQPKETHNAQG